MGKGTIGELMPTIKFWIRHFWKIIVLFWIEPCIRGGSEAGIADAERDSKDA